MFTHNMDETVYVSVRVTPLANERVELVLKAAEGTAEWSRVYDGLLFLSMDAQALDLLESVPAPVAGGPKYRLKHAGFVSTEQLHRMRFVKARNEAQGDG